MTTTTPDRIAAANLAATCTLAPFGEISADVVLDGQIIGSVFATHGVMRNSRGAMKSHRFASEEAALEAVVSAHLFGYWYGEQ